MYEGNIGNTNCKVEKNLGQIDAKTAERSLKSLLFLP